jgi:hypothetical protein
MSSLAKVDHLPDELLRGEGIDRIYRINRRREEDSSCADLS